MASATTASDHATVNAHPLYTDWAPTWRLLRDVYEGIGGFIDPAKPYLAPHPREWLDHDVESNGKRVPNPNPQQPSPKLTARRKLARYENVAAMAVDAYAGALFRVGPTRAFGSERPRGAKDIQAFWDDADGAGHSLTDVLRAAWTAAGVFGHTPVVMDRLNSLPQPGPRPVPTAPMGHRPVVRLYTPLDLVDWLTDDAGHLTAVKLLEPELRTEFTAADRLQHRTRVLTATHWTVTTSQGRETTGEHGFGRLPAELLYAKRRMLVPVIGQSVLHDPQLYIDLYNLNSEEREILRSQTFGLLNIPLGDMPVEQAMAMMGQQSGTQSVLFSAQQGTYLSPDADNVRVYHESQDRLLRTIYRLLALPWEGDSRDAESAESRQLKRADLHQVLASFADELQQTELRLCELVYRGVFGDRWESAWDHDQPYVEYPSQFDVSSIEEAVEACDATIRLDLGETTIKAAKKATARRLVPGLSPVLQKQSDNEIDAQTIESADDRRKRTEAAMAAAFAPKDEGDKDEDDPAPPNPQAEADEDPNAEEKPKEEAA